MRMYGRRFLKNSMKNAADARTESRDGIVIDIDHDNKFCRVKIQGSEEYIVAHFPENIHSTPSWLRPANAVRICHRGGNRGKVEVVGSGQTIPTGINVKPPQQIIPRDCIMSGCELTMPTVARNVFGVGKGILWVMMGTYRIQGTVRSTLPLLCRKNMPLRMENMPRVGSIAEQFVFSLPREGQWGYQRIVLNPATGRIEALAGRVGSEPSLPELPNGKLDCGWVLLQGGKQVIDEMDINVFWQKPSPCYFMVDCDGYMNANQNLTEIRVGIKDQFGKPCVKAGERWRVRAKIASGLGILVASGQPMSGGSKDLITYTEVGAAEAVFYYARGLDVIVNRKDSPTIRISVDDVPFPEYDLEIALFDCNGDPL